MPVYSLYLSTFINSPVGNPLIPLNKTNLSAVSWSINWDTLFREQQKNYKYCRLRFQINSDAFERDNTDFSVYSGYLACSLASNYGGVGAFNTPLGIVYPVENPTSPATGTNNTHCIQIDTLSQIGVDISMPVGHQNLTLYFYNDDALTLINDMVDYAIFMTFELYN